MCDKGEKMFLGIDIGSTTSKAANIDSSRTLLAQAVINTGTGTRGPEKAIEAVLNSVALTKEEIQVSVVTGYGRMTYENADKQITEISCHAKGIWYFMPDARTIIDIGGQDAKVILLDENGKVENFAMNDKCAAGTGRFLEVMSRILGCHINKLSSLSQKATEEVTISSTCTVFAESEVISQLAAGAKRENVAKGAHKSVAKRVAGLAGRNRIRPDVAMTGGVALNKGVVEALEKEIGERIFVPENPQVMGAIGAALYAYEIEEKNSSKLV